MTRFIRIAIARRRLERLIRKQRESFKTQDYRRRREAMLKHTRGMANANS